MDFTVVFTVKSTEDFTVKSTEDFSKICNFSKNPQRSVKNQHRTERGRGLDARFEAI